MRVAGRAWGVQLLPSSTRHCTGTSPSLLDLVGADQERSQPRMRRVLALAEEEDTGPAADDDLDLDRQELHATVRREQDQASCSHGRKPLWVGNPLGEQVAMTRDVGASGSQRVDERRPIEVLVDENIMAWSPRCG
jgi:hypothetical protein